MPSIHTTKRKGNICLYRIHAWMITEVLFVITPNWEKKVSINKWINKHIVVYPNLKILLSNRNEWTTDTFNNVDEPQNSYLNERSRPPAKKKQKNTKLFILDESIQKWKLSYGGRKQIIDHGLGWGYGQQEKGGKETRKLLREGSMFTIFSTWCFPMCACVKTYWILKFEFTQYIYVNYSLIKLLNIF